MICNRRTLILGLSCTLTALLASQATAKTVIAPQRGNPLRKQLLDAVRPNFITETNGPIEFVVNRLTVSGDWAYGNVTLQRPGGKQIDWAKTQYAEDIKQGIFDPASSFFLLKRKGNGWKIVDYVVGPTDVTWDGWRHEYNLPTNLFIDP